jgi:hypothetical protein
LRIEKLPQSQQDCWIFIRYTQKTAYGIGRRNVRWKKLAGKIHTACSQFEFWAFHKEPLDQLKKSYDMLKEARILSDKIQYHETYDLKLNEELDFALNRAIKQIELVRDEIKNGS